MIVPISFFDPNNGQKTTIVARIQELYANGVESITVTELEKTYTPDPTSQLELVHDATLYFNLISKNSSPASVETQEAQEGPVTPEPTVAPATPAVSVSPATHPGKYSWMVVFVLCWFLGVFGAHRFYVGRIGTAVAQLCTLGGLGIWTFIDFILILCGQFRDSDGERVMK